MSWTIEWAKSAAKALGKLERAERRRIQDAVHRYAECGAGDVKKLQGTEGYRLRVGLYRVVFELEHGRLVILVLRVSHRREVYR